MKKALIFHGGWDGHQPTEVAHFLAGLLRNSDFEVKLVQDLQVLADRGDALKELDLIVPLWTMGEITHEQVMPLIRAVESGVGLAGCHGGMCDAFRGSCEYQFMTGGQWVAHPGNDGVDYTVNISDPSHEITKGISDFAVKSEQYYMHVDPSNKVLATTRFPTVDGPHVPNGPFDMPVIWTRKHGKGKVFYCSLGHQLDVIEKAPADEIMRRGMIWAAR